MNAARIALAVVILASSGYYVWQQPGPRAWRQRRREVRAARDQVRDLHSGHIDALPRSGGPRGGPDA